MKVSFAFSPCPNDTFMFEPIVNKRIDLEGLSFDIELMDVEQLNKAAESGKYDITKLSFNAFTRLTDTYQLLNSGSALGRGCGPLLISKTPISDAEIPKSKIGIPGKNTTANLLLSIAFPDALNKEDMLFSDIEEALLAEKIDAGLIIHENRFTYKAKGLLKLIDLGEYWEKTTGFPIPLGGIGVKRDLSVELKYKIDRIIHRSVAYAFAHPTSGKEYIRCHAQEMDEQVMYDHINLYVNNFSQELGDEGREAVLELFKKLLEMKRIDKIPPDIFVKA